MNSAFTNSPSLPLSATNPILVVFHVETNHDAGGFELKFVFVISTIIAIFATDKQNIVNNATRNRKNYKLTY